MRIAIVTDAWFPQVNGVVRTLAMTLPRLEARGCSVLMITPEQFTTLPLPGYREIRVAFAPRLGTRAMLGSFAPDVVHIVTEGPIGWSARRWCLDHNIPYTSAFHTRFPDYMAVRTGLSADWFWPLMRRFHAASRAVFASTCRLINELEERGLPQGVLWSRGIDRTQFHPAHRPHEALRDLPRPILLNVGRVAAEKNLDAFLALDMPGTKVVIGAGPALPDLRRRYPEALFPGVLQGAALAQAYATADLFVFPSLTDTFGLVMIEALACGTPVAGYPVAGPLDIVGPRGRGPTDALPRRVGALNSDLSLAITEALRVDRSDAAAYGVTYDWDRSTDQFLAGLETALDRPRVSQRLAV